MSQYKLIEVVKTSEKEEQSIYDRDNLNTALADMKNDFGVAVKAETTLCVYCVVIDQTTGNKIGGKYWSLTSSVGDNENLSDNTIRQRVYTHNDYADDNITPYESEKLAIGNFNTKAAAAMKKEECNFALTVRIDGTGFLVDVDLFNKENN